MRILSPNGRLNRLQYFLQSFVTAFVLHAAVATYVIWTMAVMRGSDPADFGDTPANAIALAALFLFGLLCSWILLVSQVKRLHDLNQSGWLVLINLIPGAGLVMWLVLVFARGHDRPNTYGMATA